MRAWTALAAVVAIVLAPAAAEAGTPSAPSGNAASLLGREHQARVRTLPQARLVSLGQGEGGLWRRVIAGQKQATIAGRGTSWWERREAAVRYVEGRQGVVSFALVTPRGKLRGHRKWRPAPSASVLKAMLLVAYLNRASVRKRALTQDDRALLAPMIRWSDNVTATRVLGIVGARKLDRLADRAGMRHFRLRSPWGLSEITAGDQARFFYRIDRYVPRRHRGYARWLLAHVVRSQRWGIPPEVPSAWRIFFKGGWGTGTGRVTHQSALLQDGRRRLSIAVLTEWNPSHGYGTRTIRGLAARLLRTPLPLPAE